MVFDSIWRIRSRVTVDLTNLVEGLGLAVGHAEAHCDHTGFTLGECRARSGAVPAEG